jgi:DNA-binding MarR family transcriptional regulator
MGKRELPSRETLEKAAKQVPEIDVPSVETLLQFLQASDEIHHSILDVLEKEYQLSEGKMMVMMILQQTSEGLTPSTIAAKANVTRATISVMLQRLIRDGLAYSFSNAEDGRGKYVAITEKGRAFLDEILPGHYLRTSQLMGKLTEQEQHILIRLLQKIVE